MKMLTGLPQQSDKLLFVKYSLPLRASAQDFRGNPPVEWNQVTISTKKQCFPVL